MHAFVREVYSKVPIGLFQEAEVERWAFSNVSPGFHPKCGVRLCSVTFSCGLLVM